MRFVIIDDRSTDPRLRALLDRCAADPRVEIWTNETQLGPNGGQAVNFPKVVARFPDAQVFALCDDDIIYHPEWLQRLYRAYQEAGRVGIRGIFSALNVPIRPSYQRVELPSCAVLLKERQAALNWLVPREIYELVGPFRDAGIAYDTEYCNRMAALKVPVVCMQPSYVQNIGYFGAYQSGNEYTAPDYVGRRDLWLWGRDLLLTTRKAARSLVFGRT